MTNPQVGTNDISSVDDRVRIYVCPCANLSSQIPRLMSSRCLTYDDKGSECIGTSPYDARINNCCIPGIHRHAPGCPGTWTTFPWSRSDCCPASRTETTPRACFGPDTGV